MRKRKTWLVTVLSPKTIKPHAGPVQFAYFKKGSHKWVGYVLLKKPNTKVFVQGLFLYYSKTETVRVKVFPNHFNFNKFTSEKGSQGSFVIGKLPSGHKGPAKTKNKYEAGIKKRFVPRKVKKRRSGGGGKKKKMSIREEADYIRKGVSSWWNRKLNKKVGPKKLSIREAWKQYRADQKKYGVRTGLFGLF